MTDLLQAHLEIDPARISFCIINLGCKVNKVEADELHAHLSALGCIPKDQENAQFIIINSCTVTSVADKKTLKTIRHALRSNPDAFVYVTGCGAALDSNNFTNIDKRVFVIDKFSLLTYLHDLCEKNHIVPLRMGEAFRTRVNIKIQDGCDHACTYCIVHVARGKARSVNKKQVLEEIRHYFDQGVKEIILTGIDLASYQFENADLSMLLREITNMASLYSDENGITPRVRISSMEPLSVDDALIRCIADCAPTICRHFHLPVQSGSSKVLSEMNRPYTRDEYLYLCERLNTALPSLSLTTDIICGFPGETDKDFEETLTLAREVGFSKIHVFPYSKRKGTPAALRTDQVDPEIINERCQILRNLSKELRRNDREKRRGMQELCIIEPRQAISESYHALAVPQNARIGDMIYMTL